ncbi:MAG: GNAT family N-acetyltransferase [Thermoflexales bacterium]|nr:GNAT family N-acetyltransferase [Thermoflexales bacterium]
MDDRTEIYIRLATLDDAEIIVHHRRAMFVDLDKADAASLDAMDATFRPFVRRGLAEGSYLGWLACTSDGQVVAGAGLIVHEWMAGPNDPAHPCRAYIANVYTGPAYRGRGIARQLVTAAVDWCRAQGFRVISLHASDYGAPLYRSLGFEPTNEMQLKL